MHKTAMPVYLREAENLFSGFHYLRVVQLTCFTQNNVIYGLNEISSDLS